LIKYLFRKKVYRGLAAALDVVGYGFTRLFRRPEASAVSLENKTILLIRLDHLGDVLAATGIPQVLKEYCPKSRVIFLVSSWAAPLLENNPFVDELVIYDAPWFSKRRYAGGKAGLGYFQLIRVLRSKRIDIGLGLRGDLRENFLMACSGIKTRIGYGVTGGGFLLNREADYRHGIHETQHALDLLKTLNLEVKTLVPRIYFSEKETARFDSRLASLELSDQGRWVGFQVGAGSEAKEWPRENVRAFFDAFATRFKNRRVVLVGSDEAKAKEIVMAHPQLSFVNFAGQTSLRELCLLMKKFECFIGHDSGPTHLAAVLGIRTIFLYSGTNSFEQWKPLAEEAVVLRRPVPCSPCGFSVCNVPGHPCLSQISPEEVIRALEKSRIV